MMQVAWFCMIGAVVGGVIAGAGLARRNGWQYITGLIIAAVMGIVVIGMVSAGVKENPGAVHRGEL
jgi:hypothetical protein